ncbi:hypothetical protein TorRG33x02_132820, partial [Trema orientale]
MREKMEALWTNFKERIWQPITKSSTKTSALFIFIFFLFVGAFVATRFLDDT